MKIGGLRPLSVWMPALLLGGLVWTHRWICDDGFIYLHVADNLSSGLGPVFNPGERVEAYTSPAWLGLITLIGVVLKPVSPSGMPPFEWIAVALGIACSIGAYAAASIGADRLWRADERSLPAGGLVMLGLVPFWDFGTSGLESSLVLFWLGLSFAGLVSVRDNPRRPAEIATAVAVGLGPLVRPDLAIFSFLWGLVLLGCLPSWRRRLELLVPMAALPLGYQLFRMGYFASFLPNTAIAKEASLSAWTRGWLYFRDFETNYQAWIPLLLLAAATLWATERFWSNQDRQSAALAATTTLGGLLHGIYVIRVGGDFLHARLLLPAVFALALPTFTLPLPLARWLAPALSAWAVGCLAFAQVRLDPEGIGMERGRLDYIDLSKNDHPVTNRDHREMHWISASDLLEQIQALPGSAGTKATWFFSEGSEPPLHRAELSAWVPNGVEGVAAVGAIGIFGFQARQRIYVCDRYGLADPYGSRAELPVIASPTGRRKAGHEKELPDSWCLARLVEALDGQGHYSAEVSMLRSVLTCGDLAELRSAVDDPMTWNRFWKNVWWSPRLTGLRIPLDSAQAPKRFCQE